MSKYQIKRGDTLSEIAERRNVPIEKLLKANPQITDPDKIYAGREMTIPGEGVRSFLQRLRGWWSK